MSARVVTTQVELDAALADPAVSSVIISSPRGVWLHVSNNGINSATVEAWGSATVEASGSATVRAWESATVRASGSTTVEAWDSTTVEAWDSATVEAWDSATVRATAWVAIHLHSARATVSGGHIIDVAALDLTDPETWRAYSGLAVDPAAGMLRASRVSSQDHPARLGRDGQIRCGCWSGTLDAWRQMVASEDWPSGCDEATRTRFRPRLEAWADLCEQQLAAWAAVQS